MFPILRRGYFIMNIHCFQRNISAASSPLVPVQLPSRLETHLWYILPDEVKSTSLLNQYLEILTPCERENVHRMQGDQLKKGALLARVLIRTTIARYWKNDEERCLPQFHFNISHTPSLIACGVTVGSPIGIDVEEKQRRTKNNILAFARRYLTPSEVEFLTAIADSEVQRQEFIKLWTLKESYVKALGRGFSAAPFNTFNIHFRLATEGGFRFSGNSNSEASEIIVEPSNEATNFTSNWQFALLDLASSHYAAICIEKDNTIIGKEQGPMKLTVRKTIPYVEDECVSGTSAVVAIGGLIWLS